MTTARAKRPFDGYKREISVQSASLHLVASSFPWSPILRIAMSTHKPLRCMTYTLPEMTWLAEQFPRLSFANISLLADERFLPQAEQMRNAYPSLSIGVHPKIHSKIALLAPESVFLSSGNMGSQGQHDTTVEMTSRVLHDWYLENVWMPLWIESIQVAHQS